MRTESANSPIRALKTSAAAKYLGMSASWLRKQRLRGKDDPGIPGPAFIRLPSGSCVYEITELDRWLDALAGRAIAGQAAEQCNQAA